MGRNAVETVMGAVVLMVAAFFVYFTYTSANVQTVRGYDITARFLKIGGLNEGSDVRISGIKVGSVTEHRLDGETYDAVVSLSISPEVKIPDDSVASIASSGMLGDKYVRLEPGESKNYVAAGGELKKTKDYRSLEDQVGEIIFLATSPGGEDKDKSP